MFKFLFRKKWLSILIILIIILTGFYFLKNGKENTEIELFKVKLGEVKQIVTVTGTVEADPQIDLKFEKTGTVAKVDVKLGQKVAKGILIGELKNSDEKIQVDQATAQLKIAQANLNLKLAGAGKEDIAISLAAMNSAKSSFEAAANDLANLKEKVVEDVKKSEISAEEALSLENSKKQALERATESLKNTKKTYEQNLENSLQSGRLAVEQALVAAQSALASADNILGVNNADFNDSYENLLGALNKITKTDAENSFRTAYGQYLAVKRDFDNLDSKNDQDKIVEILDKTLSLLNKIQTALTDTHTMLEYSLTSSPFTPEVLNTKKTTMATEKSNVNTAQGKVETAKQNIASAKLSLEREVNTAESSFESAQAALNTAENNAKIAKNTLTQSKLSEKSEVQAAKDKANLYESEYKKAQASYEFKVAKLRDVELASFIAEVDRAKANLELAKLNLEKTKIFAPFEGVVAKINYSVGENVSLGGDFIRLIAPKMKITANVSEVDITKIDLADPTQVTFDALPLDQKFSAEIIEIEPAETIVQGVVYYQIKAAFKNDPKEIKPGMTANLEIAANQKDKVLVVPSRAVKYSSEGKYVELQGKEKGEIIKRIVKIGLEGDLFVEILDGLKEGEEVITYLKN